MSVQDEITRLENAKIAIKGSIENKGVFVAEETTLSGYAECIDRIETGTDTSDATATAEEIFAGKTAYNASGKVTGTFTIEEELAAQTALINEISTILDSKAGGGGVEVSTGNVIFEGQQPIRFIGTSFYDGEIHLEDSSVNAKSVYSNIISNSIIFIHAWNSIDVGNIWNNGGTEYIVQMPSSGDLTITTSTTAGGDY